MAEARMDDGPVRGDRDHEERDGRQDVRDQVKPQAGPAAEVVELDLDKAKAAGLDMTKAGKIRAGKKTGNKSFVPTDEQRQQVSDLAGFGIKQSDIAKIIYKSNGKPIKLATLKKYFKAELAVGAVTANAQVVKSLFEKAIGNANGSTAAAIFWTKARMGWKEDKGNRMAVKQVDDMTEEEIIAFLGGEPTEEELQRAASRGAARLAKEGGKPNLGTTPGKPAPDGSLRSRG